MTKHELITLARRVCVGRLSRRGNLADSSEAFARLARRLGHNGPILEMAQAYATATNTGRVAVLRLMMGK